jgi:hypothetical protein
MVPLSTGYRTKTTLELPLFSLLANQSLNSPLSHSFTSKACLLLQQKARYKTCLSNAGKMRRTGVTITLRDLRVAKLDRNQRVAPCRMELENFLAATQRYGGDDTKVPKMIAQALADCMQGSTKSTKGASLAFHLAKHVVRKKS